MLTNVQKLIPYFIKQADDILTENSTADDLRQYFDAAIKTPQQIYSNIDALEQRIDNVLPAVKSHSLFIPNPMVRDKLKASMNTLKNRSKGGVSDLLDDEMFGDDNASLLNKVLKRNPQILNGLRLSQLFKSTGNAVG